jgi:hypothetical protein
MENELRGYTQMNTDKEGPQITQMKRGRGEKSACICLDISF